MIIEMDGVNWPLETFIDAYGYTRDFDLREHWVDHPSSLEFEVNVVHEDGSITGGLARDQFWNDAIAWRPRDFEFDDIESEIDEYCY